MFRRIKQSLEADDLFQAGDRVDLLFSNDPLPLVDILLHPIDQCFPSRDIRQDDGVTDTFDRCDERFKAHNIDQMVIVQVRRIAIRLIRNSTPVHRTVIVHDRFVETTDRINRLRVNTTECLVGDLYIRTDVLIGDDDQGHDRFIELKGSFFH